MVVEKRKWKYHVTFWYDELGGVTTALVECEDGRKFEGEAYCHFKDVFHHLRGRKIALRRALAPKYERDPENKREAILVDPGMPREERRIFWAELWEKGVRK